MAGLAATLGADSPAPVTAIADALASRGPAAASWHRGLFHLIVRAELPLIREYAGRAMAIDGVAEPGALATAYAGAGPGGLVAGSDPGTTVAGSDPGTTVAGSDPYALILADPGRDALVLARHGDGPPLHWALHEGMLLVGSEPAALIAAGLPAAADQAVVRRFLAAGGCDDSAATFYARVRRVLPDQVVDITRDAGTGTFTVRTRRAAAPAVGTPEQALARACRPGRVGVRLASGYAGAAALGVALAHAGQAGALPVYSTPLPELSVTGHRGTAMLGPLSAAVRHQAIPLFVDEIDIDAYLRELGEPTPEVDDWLLWALARRIAGEVDALIEPVRVGAHLSRLADRIASRFGLVLRTPMRELAAAGDLPRADLAQLAGRMLPAGCLIDPVPTGGLAHATLAQLRTDLVASFLPWPRALADTLALLAGDRVNAERLWREYLVARWLRQLAPPAAALPAPPPPVAGWRAIPVRTEALEPDDKVAERIAWHIGEAARGLQHEWYAVVGAKPLAVMQGRARPLWRIQPGRTARVLHRLARRTRLGMPWTMQVAIEQSGRLRMAVAAGCAALGLRRGWAAVAGRQVRAIRGPREDAVWPAHIAVVPAPASPDQVAAEVVAALRGSLPELAYTRLGGCIIAGDEALGFAPGPGGASASPDLAAWRCNQAGEYAPFALLVRQPASVEPGSVAAGEHAGWLH